LPVETTVTPPASLLGGPVTSRLLFGPTTRTVQHSTKTLVGGILTIETTMIQCLVKNMKVVESLTCRLRIFQSRTCTLICRTRGHETLQLWTMQHILGAAAHNPSSPLTETHLRYTHVYEKLVQAGFENKLGPAHITAADRSR
jgi:hypothetical protein